MAEYFAQIGESLRTHEDVCHDLTAADEYDSELVQAEQRIREVPRVIRIIVVDHSITLVDARGVN